jgi:hypothetical protein
LAVAESYWKVRRMSFERIRRSSSPSSVAERVTDRREQCSKKYTILLS